MKTESPKVFSVQCSVFSGELQATRALRQRLNTEHWILNTFLLLALTFLTAAPTHAASWAERAGQLNRTELSADEARKRGADDDKDARNKLCVRSVKPQF